MACCSLIAAENCALQLTILAELAPWCTQMDWVSFRYTSTSRSTTFSQLENADSPGGIGTILVSFLKDGLISASVSCSTKHADLLHSCEDQIALCCPQVILRQRPSQVCDTNIRGDAAAVLGGRVRADLAGFGHGDYLNDDSAK